MKVVVPLTLKYWVALYLLLYLLAMAHEAAHLVVGYFSCGTFVGLTFNRVLFPDGCATGTAMAAAAGLAGPVVSYAGMWIGAILLRVPSRAPFGYAMIFASLPMARVITAAFRAGDEVSTLGTLYGAPGVLVAMLSVLLLSSIPVFLAAHATANRNRAAVVLLMLLVPMLADWVIRLQLLELLLRHAGIAATPIFGVPALVHAVALVVLMIFIASKRVRSALDA